MLISKNKENAKVKYIESLKNICIIIIKILDQSKNKFCFD